MLGQVLQVEYLPSCPIFILSIFPPHASKGMSVEIVVTSASLYIIAVYAGNTLHLDGKAGFHGTATDGSPKTPNFQLLITTPGSTAKGRVVKAGTTYRNHRWNDWWRKATSDVCVLEKWNLFRFSVVESQWSCDDHVFACSTWGRARRSRSAIGRRRTVHFALARASRLILN